MLTFIQENLGSIAVMLVVALIVLLAIRRMVLDKKAGIGICGQKCSQCPKFESCESSMNNMQNKVECDGACAGCQYKASCNKG